MNTKTVWKMYFDFEKEERWLNAMAAEGWALVRYGWRRYTFAQSAPGEWTYRLELLPKAAGAAESREYLDSMREHGVETVATSASWVYFRKRTGEGPFELFDNAEARIAHHKRVGTMYGTVAAALLPMTVSSLNQIGHVSWLAPALALELALIVGVALASASQWRVVRRLQQSLSF